MFHNYLHYHFAKFEFVKNNIKQQKSGKKIFCIALVERRLVKKMFMTVIAGVVCKRNATSAPSKTFESVTLVSGHLD